MKKLIFICLLFFVFPGLHIEAQEKEKSPVNEATFSGMKLRSVGPSFTSGRIADIAIHPEDDNVWYVAVGSGGVWKTYNAGTTWNPIFDDQASYSTGCITIDPNNPSTLWLGTGENVGGRHVAFGDGIYKSEDDGTSWKNMGLKESQHISKIIVHPANSDIIWVAVQGPLWNKGGERGLFKSTDGGRSWNKTLGDEEWMGVTDIAIDPRNPDVMFAATWQRHRTIAAYMGGGPKSGLHKSVDGGETWSELTRGLPKGNKGKIGLAVSPQNPDILYAAIELNRTKGAVYKSTNRGASWKKQSDAVSGGPGPHYYQELYASPHAFDRLYLMDVRIQVSDDGGKTFRRLNESIKHSDNHAIAFRDDDPDYLLVGSDGGLYESFDLAKTWRFFDNMPITQYYKLAVDDREPFYHIFGGTQDNGSHGGPSRTDNRHGIRNADWYKTLGADGHQSATEPGNPDIIYAETQQGGLSRVDLTTGEQISIQPQPLEGEEFFERYNWDAPILISPHSVSRLYFASQRVWRSDNRGDSWTPISGDLSRNQERISLPIMGKVQSWDSPWDVGAMSNYNTITSLAESPVQEGLIYAGTDDGIIQLTENGGASWKKIDVSSLPGCPSTAFVNDIKADLFDVNTVYVALDNHKYGDLKPYLYKSTNRGQNWTSISANIPDRTLVWRLVQDHVKPDLMFLGTEFGIYFTVDGGDKWVKFKAGVPTISFRDLAIQRRENDLIGASFGRSFYVLDDYSPLREMNEEVLQQEAALFSARKAWQYNPRSIIGSQGAQHYSAENPPYGAIFTYHLSKGFSSLSSERQKKEKELAKKGDDIPFPGWDALEEERMEQKPKIWLTVKDNAGKVIRNIEGKTSKGLHRIAWNLTYASKRPINMERRQSFGRFGNRGVPVSPGTYTVTLSKEVEGQITQLAGPVSVEVAPLRKGVLTGSSPEEITAFGHEVASVSIIIQDASSKLSKSIQKVNAMQQSLAMADIEPGDLNSKIFNLKQQLMDLDEMMNGNRSKQEIGERNNPTIRTRIGIASRGTRSLNYGPTAMHRANLEIAKKMIGDMSSKIDRIVDQDMGELEKALLDAGAPAIQE